MMKKLFLSLSLVAVMIMAFGMITSGAWFTSSAQTGGTQIKLGVLAPHVEAAPMTITNAAPGIASAEQTVKIVNNGESTLAVKYKISAGYVGGNNDLYNNLWVRVERPVWDSNANAWTREVVFNGWLKDLAINPDTLSQTARLNVDESHMYYIILTPSKDLNNDFQAQSTTFHLVFDATQVENPGW